jgi:hypothetical protein
MRIRIQEPLECVSRSNTGGYYLKFSRKSSREDKFFRENFHENENFRENDNFRENFRKNENFRETKFREKWANFR